MGASDFGVRDILILSCPAATVINCDADMWIPCGGGGHAACRDMADGFGIGGLGGSVWIFAWASVWGHIDPPLGKFAQTLCAD